MIVHNGHRKLQEGQRIALGHELVGDIAAVGDGVEDFRVGQRVGIAPNTGCGNCSACQRGRSNYCPDYKAFGITRDGSHASLLRVPGLGEAQPSAHRLLMSLAGAGYPWWLFRVIPLHHLEPDRRPFRPPAHLWTGLGMPQRLHGRSELRLAEPARECSVS